MALSFAELKPPVGRGERTMLSIGESEALLIDESYNANPASCVRRSPISALLNLVVARGGLPYWAT